MSKVQLQVDVWCGVSGLEATRHYSKRVAKSRVILEPKVIMQHEPQSLFPDNLAKIPNLSALTM